MLGGRTLQESRDIIQGWRKVINGGDVYGFGLSPRLYVNSPLPYNEVVEFKGIFDNNPELQGKTFFGYKILNPDAIANISGKIVVLPKWRGAVGSYNQIRDQLTALGLRESYDFIRLDSFWTLLSYFKYQTLLLYMGLNLMVTTRCTLRCRHCFTAAAQWSERKDFPVEKLKKDIIDYLDKTDLVSELAILGGEPLLHKDLAELVEFIGSNFRYRISHFFIITNATIKPSQDLLAVCKKYQVQISFSDYRDSGIKGYEEKYLHSVAEVENYGIRAYHQGFNSWFLPVLTPEQEIITAGFSDDELRRHYGQCSFAARSAYESGRYYPCHRADCRGEVKGIIEPGSVDISHLSASRPEDRDELMMYFLSYTPHGYMENCRHCPGLTGSRFRIDIPMAEQMSREEQAGS